MSTEIPITYNSSGEAVIQTHTADGTPVRGQRERNSRPLPIKKIAGYTALLAASGLVYGFAGGLETPDKANAPVVTTDLGNANKVSGIHTNKDGRPTIEVPATRGLENGVTTNAAGAEMYVVNDPALSDPNNLPPAPIKSTAPETGHVGE